MSKENNTIKTSVDSLLKGMEGFISSRTVVGEPVAVNDTIILPLIDVQFGMGAGSFAGGSKDKAAGGISAKMSPNAVLIIQNGSTRLVSVKNQDTVTKIIDMVPDLMNKFSAKKQKEDPEVDAKVEEILSAPETETQN